MEKRLVFMLILLVNLGIIFNAFAEQNLELVIEGKEKAVIILPVTPSSAAQEGAQILSDHIYQISGARPKIFNELALGNTTLENNRIVPARPIADNYILIGETNLTKKITTIDDLGPGGILIQTFGNCLVLAGPDKMQADPWGTRYAVITFLEEFLGIRYLWPGELGKVVPQNQNITVPVGIEKRYTPPIQQRQIRCSFYSVSDRVQDGLDFLGLTSQEFLQIRRSTATTVSNDGGWINWQRLGGTLGLSTGHAFGSLWDKYGQEHEEWFALQPDGSRNQSREPGRARLCKSNQELRAQIALDKIGELNKKPSLKSVSLSPNDGGSYMTFCMCDNCKALDHPDGRKVTFARGTIEWVSLTDRIINFSNDIAQQVVQLHPDVLLSVDAYSVYTAPPLREVLHPNLFVRFVGIDYSSEELRHRGLEDWDGWCQMTSKIFWRPNLLHYGTRTGTLNTYAHKLASDFNYLAKNGMFATDFDSISHNWATDGLNFYVLSKLLWDPDFDVDKVIDDYCQSGFGKGAPFIKEYFLRVEELTNDYSEGRIQGYNATAPYTEEVVEELKVLLDQACFEVKKDRNNPEFEKKLKRIVFLQTGLDFNALQAQIYRIHQKRVNGEPYDRFEACELLDRRYEMMMDIFSNNHYAINVAYITWADKGLMKYLGWYGPTNK